MLEITQSLKESMFIASLFIAALFIISTVSLALRNYEASQQLKKLEKWREFSEIEKAQKHEEYDQLATELAEEKSFSKMQGGLYTRLLLRHVGFKEENEKTTHTLTQKETFIAELKKELEQYQNEIMSVRADNDQLKSKLSRKNLARDAKGRVLPKGEVAPERDWTTATKDELLAEAKRRYPVGTKFRIVHFPHIIMTVKSHDTYKNTFNFNESNLNFLVNKPTDTCKGASVYGDGKWAQIIS